ncbi:MAG TPA: PEP-utilizing enzyme [Dehalococcoidia bacterium]|nr:PEP-utilizing enzyme [Dehalococcoidia bacterium]
MPDTVDFRLPDASFDAYTWIISDEHTPVAAPPLTGDLFERGGRGVEQIPRSLKINGYTYQRHGTGMGPGDPPWAHGTPPDSLEQMRRWRSEWQPEVDKVVEALTSFDPGIVQPGSWREVLDEQLARYWGVFGPVHREAVMPAHAIARSFEQAYVSRFGASSRSDAHALLQGMPNASLERAALLWDLSRLLRADNELAEAIACGADLPQTESGRAFDEGLRDLQRRFGSTNEGFVEDRPTWGEDPSVPLSAIRAYAGQPDGRGPLDSARRQAERREALTAELRELAQTDAEAVELLRMLPIAQELMPNLEDHNYYTDQRLNAASRARWLAIGRHLQSRGVVDAEDDVFYFYRPELIVALDGDAPPARATLAERRASLAAWRSVAPPPVLGAPLPESDEPLPEGLHASEVRVLRGIGASAGSYRGRARVIETLAQAATLEPGDILVARATTPAWTPFFGIVSALVINVGGALSHASVVAREFGLPAVVGTIKGTAVIRDGATLTVDGTNGLVLIEE